MLLSCIILGCSISSFAYRRQESDRYQTPIFVFAIAAASTVGFGLGVTANLIMLVWIPWAIFAAMLFSICVHGISGRCARSTETIRCQIMINEKSGGHWEFCKQYLSESLRGGVTNLASQGFPVEYVSPALRIIRDGNNHKAPRTLQLHGSRLRDHLYIFSKQKSSTTDFNIFTERPLLNGTLIRLQFQFEQ